jgi:hypothetical protein
MSEAIQLSQYEVPPRSGWNAGAASVPPASSVDIERFGDDEFLPPPAAHAEFVLYPMFTHVSHGPG